MSTKPLSIVATGMCCAVGFSTLSSVAAISAGMDHFRETDFIDNTGKALIGAQLYQINLWGSDRLIWMFDQAVTESLSSLNVAQQQDLDVMLILPEPDRPGINPLGVDVLCKHVATYSFASTNLFHGKAGIGLALQAASAHLHNGECHRVLVVGIDSYFTAQTITHYLEAERLMTQDNTDGFIPGEGCGAVLLQKSVPEMTDVRIMGTGVEHEPAHILQTQIKMMAKGMSVAIRNAVAESGMTPGDTHFHMSDISGENFYFREAALAITRCIDRKIPDYPHLLLASKLGETGAACGPLMLAALAHLMADESGPGQRGLLHFSGDDGQRAAIMIKQGA